MFRLDGSSKIYFAHISPLGSNTVYFITNSADGSGDIVKFALLDKRFVTHLVFSFKDWGYSIAYCTPGIRILKFTTTPPSVSVKHKIWELTKSVNGLNLKCNGVEVLDFVYRDEYNPKCVTQVKGKETTRLRVSEDDTATTSMAFQLVGM